MLRLTRFSRARHWSVSHWNKYHTGRPHGQFCQSKIMDGRELYRPRKVVHMSVFEPRECHLSNKPVDGRMGREMKVWMPLDVCFLPTACLLSWWCVKAITCRAASQCRFEHDSSSPNTRHHLAISQRIIHVAQCSTWFRRSICQWFSDCCSDANVVMNKMSA